VVDDFYPWGKPGHGAPNDDGLRKRKIFTDPPSPPYKVRTILVTRRFYDKVLNNWLFNRPKIPPHGIYVVCSFCLSNILECQTLLTSTADFENCL